jgi:hypothetical protein
VFLLIGPSMSVLNEFTESIKADAIQAGAE